MVLSRDGDYGKPIFNKCGIGSEDFKKILGLIGGNNHPIDFVDLFKEVGNLDSVTIRTCGMTYSRFFNGVLKLPDPWRHSHLSAVHACRLARTLDFRKNLHFIRTGRMIYFFGVQHGHESPSRFANSNSQYKKHNLCQFQDIKTYPFSFG